MEDSSLRSTKIMPQILWSGLHAWGGTLLGLLQISLPYWLAYWILMRAKRAPVLFAFATHLIFPSSRSKTCQDFCLVPTRNIMALFVQGRNCFMPIVKRPFRN